MWFLSCSSNCLSTIKSVSQPETWCTLSSTRKKICVQNDEGDRTNFTKETYKNIHTSVYAFRMLWVDSQWFLSSHLQIFLCKLSKLVQNIASCFLNSVTVLSSYLLFILKNTRQDTRLPFGCDSFSWRPTESTSMRNVLYHAHEYEWWW